jgi:tRNA modification GTPase
MDSAAVELRTLRDRVDDLLRGAARGRMIREGGHVAIIGTPNVGKSSLFNALLDANRAIVTDVPGTTRDLLTERLDVHGFPVALVDTAGIRVPGDAIEEEGIARARQAASIADVTVLVVDGSQPMKDADRELLAWNPGRRVVAVNKSDLPRQLQELPPGNDVVAVSARARTGLDQLLGRIAAQLGGGTENRDAPLVSNVRHIRLLELARDGLDRAIDAVTAGTATSEEFVLADLQNAEQHLQEITGRRTTDDLLRHIFERFCIGK